MVNYDANGKKNKSVSEFVSVKFSSSTNKAFPVAGTLLGPVYNIVASIIKNSLEKKQKSYTNAYSNSVMVKPNEINFSGGPIMQVKRFAINSLSDVDEKYKVAEYDFAISQQNEGLEVRLDSLGLMKSKARYNPGDHLSISITIKATSYTQDKTDIKTKDAEGTIVIPIMEVSNENVSFRDKQDIIGKILLPGIIVTSANSVKISISITEVNISHIDPSTIQTIVSNNAADIQAILKAIFGVSDSK